ncbi:MAG TPA: MBL fold metallo-hydrolase [Anaerolineae bacterium]|nr:MBL fold metallo-hydrolase [Anaerolineae bacterium]
MSVETLVNKLHWLGHDTFWLEGPPIIYFDPWKLRGKLPIADVILVSHHHSDHCSPDDIQQISGPQTVVVASAPAATKLPGARTMAPGDRLEVLGITVEAVPAYNVNKFRAPGQPFHPKEEQHVGYIITVDGVRLYFAGDTDLIPEMGDFACDIALLPVSGTYVMTAEEAAAAAEVIRPIIAIPMHYGAGIGTGNDGQRFAELYSGEVKLLTAK